MNVDTQGIVRKDRLRESINMHLEGPWWWSCGKRAPLLLRRAVFKSL